MRTQAIWHASQPAAGCAGCNSQEERCCRGVGMQQAVVVEEITDISTHRALIEQSIAQYGTSVENNFMHWVYHSRKDRPNVFFHFGNNKGIMARCHSSSKNWYMIGYPLGAREEWISLLSQFVNHIFSVKHATKLYIEVEPDFRTEVCAHLKNT